MRKGPISLKTMVLLISLVFISFIAHANEVDIAKQRLSNQIRLLKTLDPEIERLDKARLIILKKAVIKVQDSISKLGLSNMQTMRSYQELIVKFRFSSAFFTEISTVRTKDTVKKIIKINEEIRTARGFDDTPYTKITESVYSHMHTLFNQLLDNRSIPNELREKIQGLITPVGKVISEAKRGDRPNTFEVGIKFYKLVVDVYPDFDGIASSHETFNIVLEIQGLNEFYGEFAQINYQD